LTDIPVPEIVKGCGYSLNPTFKQMDTACKPRQLYTLFLVLKAIRAHVCA